MYMSQAVFLSARLSTWHILMNQKPGQQMLYTYSNILSNFSLDEYWTYYYQSVDC